MKTSNRHLKLLTPLYYVINKEAGVLNGTRIFSAKSIDVVLNGVCTFAAKVIEKRRRPEILIVRVAKNNLTQITDIYIQPIEDCNRYYEYEKDINGNDKKLNWVDLAGLREEMSRKGILIEIT